MRTIRTLCGEYKEEDIFNMDETGLHWRRSLSRGLTSANHPRAEMNNDRLSLVFCCNYTGTQRLPLWVIGKASQPRALRDIDLRKFHVEWRGQRKAEVDVDLMIQWLRAFYAFIGDTRKVLLLIDNFMAHTRALPYCHPPSNIRIQWLPPKATSTYQPLDQGIMARTKAYYKEHWLKYMVEEYNIGNDPNQTVSLLHAVRWLNYSWSFDLSDATVYRCFRKAKIQPDEQSISLPQDPLADVETPYRKLRRSGKVSDLISLDDFMKAQDDEDDAPGDFIASVIGRVQEALEPADETDGAGSSQSLPPPPPSIMEVKDAVHLVLRYQECREGITPNEIKPFYYLSRHLEQISGLYP